MQVHCTSDAPRTVFIYRDKQQDAVLCCGNDFAKFEDSFEEHRARIWLDHRDSHNATAVTRAIGNRAKRCRPNSDNTASNILKKSRQLLGLRDYVTQEQHFGPRKAYLMAYSKVKGALQHAQKMCSENKGKRHNRTGPKTTISTVMQILSENIISLQQELAMTYKRQSLHQQATEHQKVQQEQGSAAETDNHSCPITEENLTSATTLHATTVASQQSRKPSNNTACTSVTTLGGEISRQETLSLCDPHNAAAPTEPPLQSKKPVAKLLPQAPREGGLTSPNYDPFAANFQDLLLRKLQPKVEKWEGVHLCNSREAAALLTKSRANNRKKGTFLKYAIDGLEFQIGGVIGQGSYATIRKAKMQSQGGNEVHDVALKLQSPPCAWEYCVSQVLHSRVLPDLCCLFNATHHLLLCNDFSVLVADLGCHTMLQELINMHFKHHKAMDEVLVMWYTAELLRMMGELHRCDILHTDVKPDNLLIRYNTAQMMAPSWQADHTDGWKDCGLTLIDFGRAIDLRLLPEASVFKGDSQTDCFRCPEMQQGCTWKYELDAYCVCCVIHGMLFGQHMKLVEINNGTGPAQYRIANKFKRYWQANLWQHLFDTLMAGGFGNTPPPWDKLLDSVTGALKHTTMQDRLKLALHKQGEFMRTLRLK